MTTRNLTSGTIAFLCVAILVRVVGYVTRVAAPVRHAPAAPDTRGWDDADEELRDHGFRVERPGPFRLTLEADRSRAGQRRTAQRVLDCLTGAVKPHYGVDVQVWRPGASDVLTVAGDGIRWRIGAGNAQPAQNQGLFRPR